MSQITKTIKRPYFITIDECRFSSMNPVQVKQLWESAQPKTIPTEKRTGEIIITGTIHPPFNEMTEITEEKIKSALKDYITKQSGSLVEPLSDGTYKINSGTGFVVVSKEGLAEFQKQLLGISNIKDCQQ